MRIELMTIAHCPGAEGARQILRDVLRSAGQSFVETTIHNEEEAQATHFLGSPTIQINGVDIEIERRNDPASISCRTYQHGEHRLCRIPEDMLRKALEENS
jgi:hypothetical protein